MGVFLSTAFQVVAATAPPAVAGAAPAAAPLAVDIHYSAPRGCPSEGWFYADVLGRIPQARRAEPGESARRFDVVVTTAGGTSHASLEFVDAEGRTVTRELSAEDCAEVVAGISVVTAVAIDPRLGETEREAPKTSAPAAPAPRPANPPPLRAPPAAERAAPWSLGVHAGAVSDVAPVWSLAAEVFSEFPLAGAVAARLSFGFADSAEFERGDASFRFWLLEGRPQLCPFPLEAGVLRFVPCVGAELGAVHGEGHESPRVTEPAGTTGFWLAVAAVSALELEIAGPLFLELQGLVRVPLLARTYVLETPAETAFETPAVGFGAFLGLGARLGR